MSCSLTQDGYTRSSSYGDIPVLPTQKSLRNIPARRPIFKSFSVSYGKGLVLITSWTASVSLTLATVWSQNGLDLLYSLMKC
jgi:hypothetical protein